MLSFLIISIQELHILAKKHALKSKMTQNTYTNRDLVYKISCQEPICQQEYIVEDFSDVPKITMR